jgi:hypothetical protein
MRTSIFAFATDVRDEGLETVLDNVERRGGVGGLTVAAAYHEGRDIFPHNPVRKVRFLEGGALFFRPDATRWDGLRLQPQVSELARERDVLRELRTATRERGLELHAWTVFLHNDTLGARDPGCAPRNAFGDPYITDLCPANPDVRAYARALAGDVAALGVDTVFAESLHYHPLEHGYAHERYFIELGPLVRYLLGLCFCEHCLEAARRLDVDADAACRFAREEIERVFAGGAQEPAEDVDREELERPLGGYLEARNATVASLVDEVARAAADEGAGLTFMDLSGAVKGYATGRPTGEPAPTIAWKLGVDLGAIARNGTVIGAIGYAVDPERLGLDLEAYRAFDTDVEVALRPMPPDCDSAENLAAKLRVVADLQVRRAHFYHYGFMRLDALDLIAEALRSARRGKSPA